VTAAGGGGGGGRLGTAAGDAIISAILNSRKELNSLYNVKCLYKFSIILKTLFW
jgi:hypothetical protein